MLSTTLMLVLSWAATDPIEASVGTIQGTVVNASQSGTPQPNAEVILQVRQDGQFIPLDQTNADQAGHFEFTHLPIGPDYLYLPGANHDGIHYPGARLQLTAAQPSATTTIDVYQSIQHPNPLVIRRHEVAIQAVPGALRVTESLLVDNPTQTTYVGRTTSDTNEPMTLALAIPMDFDRATFYKEFYGRRFSVAGDRLVTGIPWTPGRRELKFMYTIRNQDPYRVWQRPLDLPCDSMRIRITHERPDEVTCNLGSMTALESGERVFEAAHAPLPAGYVVRVELGALPQPWTAYARWVALVTLGTLMVGVVVWSRWTRPSRRCPAVPTALPNGAIPVASPHRPSRRRRAA